MINNNMQFKSQFELPKSESKNVNLIKAESQYPEDNLRSHYSVDKKHF